MHTDRATTATLASSLILLGLLSGCRYEPKAMPEPVPGPTQSSLSYNTESPVEDNTFAEPPADPAPAMDTQFAEPGPPPPPAAGYAQGSQPVAAQEPEPALPESFPEVRTYEVKKGDTLSAISLKEYGTVTRWKEIAEANPGIDPNRMQIGTVLILPD